MGWFSSVPKNKNKKKVNCTCSLHTVKALVCGGHERGGERESRCLCGTHIQEGTKRHCCVYD